MSSTGTARRQRRDARRNRDLLVVAARDVFGEQGADASLEEIARRAGVGIGTLYRHFPSRESLVDALFEERLGEFVDVAREELAGEDAWTGLARFLERTLELQAANLVLKDVLLQYPLASPGAADARAELRGLVRRLLERAIAAGAVRADCTPADLTLLLWSLSSVLETGEAAPRAWRRQLGFALDGLRPSAATPPSEPALTDAQVAEAMAALRASRRRSR